MKRLEDYRAPDWTVREIDLELQLDDHATRVVGELYCERLGAQNAPLVLDYAAMTLKRFSLDGQVVWESERGQSAEVPVAVKVTKEAIEFSGPLPPRVVVRAEVLISPANNTALSGLYRSGSGLYTQCEPEGFRRIVPFIDRPDVMARYRVRLVAERARYPVLLSNGNLVATGELPDGRHFAEWYDPFPKPSYLFAVVAADLVVREKPVTLADGRTALLQVWTQPKYLTRTAWAMESLAAALRWDERRFGRVLDLERYMVVAVEDFNMGAMENKGLNLFNVRYLLADPDTATDADYANVESVVAHEYFHNWTGNRVTCRDWFQLTLKEGLTVFRDQEFSADQLAAVASTPTEAAAARAVKRIEDVTVLRAVQFPEDDGPMAHPIRPRTYRSIDNFYTATVYEKGAEVVRMLHTLLGEAGFRRGLDRYFERFDGLAVTCEDFVAAMAEANGRDLSAFLRWYDAAGTPRVRVRAHWDAERGEYALTLRQELPGWDVETQPLVIPVRARLLDAASGTPLTDEAVLVLDASERTWRWAVPANARPLPSLLRGFSAPVRLVWEVLPHAEGAGKKKRTEPCASEGSGQASAAPRQLLEVWLTQLQVEDDAFNRWDAAQQLALAAHAHWMGAQELPPWTEAWTNGWRAALLDETLDAQYRSRLAALPHEREVSDRYRPLDPGAVRGGMMALTRALAAALGEDWQALYERTAWVRARPYRYAPRDAGARALAALALRLGALQGHAAAMTAIEAHFVAAHNLTDRLAAVDAALMCPEEALAEALLARLAQRYADDAVVLDKWFARHATRWRWQGQAPQAVFTRVQSLTEHPAFRWNNPNKVYALVVAFFGQNLPEVCAAGEAAFAFWSDALLRLDALNPLVAARLARTFEHAAEWCEPYRTLGLAAVEAAAQRARSTDVREVLERILLAAASSGR